MPYLDFLCTVCDRRIKRWHNLQRCPHCKAAVVANGGGKRSKKTVDNENQRLRGEVDRLRRMLGLGLKYE